MHTVLHLRMIRERPLETLETEGNRIANLAAGTPFNLTVSDDTLTSAAEELMRQYKNEIETAIKDAVGVKLSLSNPKVEFTNDGFNLSVKSRTRIPEIKSQNQRKSLSGRRETASRGRKDRRPHH